ncbi:hypothetical protein JL722_15141 [Aureococcus anophagefferens]|nr:hypothetical protein JL722_15141 [Aureococcus anophagefferens]
MRRALIFAVAAALAALASGDESINFFSVAASSEEVALALCAWRSYYISLRPLAPNLRFFLLAGSKADIGRTCVAASAALSRAKPHGWENQTDDWIRCRVVTAGRFGWHRGDDRAGQVQGATVTIIRPTAFPGASSTSPRSAPARRNHSFRGELFARDGVAGVDGACLAGHSANKKYANKEEISFDVMRSAPDHWLLPLGVSRAFSVDHGVWFGAAARGGAVLDAALRGVAATHDRVAVGVAWDRGCFPRAAGGLRLRDAATKEVVDTAAGHGASRDDGVLKWYACGPTVYDATHLGHARTYVTPDLVRRAATEYGGSRVDFAMGVTDVDDKIINRAKELGLEPLELARREEANFFEDLDRLGCLRPDRVLRVSEHVDDIVAYVGDIVDRGFGYATEGGDVWFDVAAQAALEAEDKASISTKKRDGRDFALWKGAKAGEISWDSPWGAGARLAHRVLGDDGPRSATLDLHAGGVDLAFPHHENEIAQWRGASGDLEGVWCPCWLHTGHLHIEGGRCRRA